MKFNFSNINKRYIGSLIIVPIIICLILGNLALKSIIFFITILAVIEFCRALKNKNININKYLIIFFTIIYYTFGIEYINILIFLFFLLLLFTLLRDKTNIIDISLTFISIFYIVIPYSFIFILSEINNYLPWIVFLCAWTTDTMAYVIGKNFGKHKLCEKISPNKTTEGFVGGIVSCVLVITCFGYVFREQLSVSILSFVVLGIIVGIIGQVGDLLASSIKRFVGIKDFGNLIPGHGGILDRFDSILLISSVVFIYSQIFM